MDVLYTFYSTLKKTVKMYESLIRIEYAKRFSVLNACKFSFRSSLKSRLIAFPILHKTKSRQKAPSKISAEKN